MCSVHAKKARLAVSFTIALLLGTEAFAVAVTPSAIQAEEVCPYSALTDDQAGPEISITEVTVSGAVELPIPEQRQIFDSIKQRTHGSALDSVTDEAVERAKEAWQDRGYFKVQVTGEAKVVSSNPVAENVALRLSVDEGYQYSLGKIGFKHNKVIGNANTLRSLFPIKDGEIFSREKIAKGLEDLRKAYDKLGYINVLAQADTDLDEQQKFAYIVVDVDEGEQYRMGKLDVLALDESTRRDLLTAFPIKAGDVFDESVYESFMSNTDFPDCTCGFRRSLIEHPPTVSISFDLRPCTSR